jgi:[ribosomal protein S5]-alanine N-acetyltransferase
MYLPLNGRRLRLREFTPADGARMYEIYADEAVMRWVGHGPVASRTESDAMLAGYIEHQKLYGYSFWAVQEIGSGRLIGDAGLYMHGHEVEIGYTLAYESWGRGYATEVGRLCVSVAFERLALPALMAVTRAENAASSRVLAKLGFTAAGQKLEYGHPHHVYRLRNPEPSCEA